MNRITTLSLSAVFMSASLLAQTQITNGGFENWGNASPGTSAEPTNWYSNKSGSNVAQLASATLSKDATTKHSGTASVLVQTISYFGTAVNGSGTTGVVNAPNTSKATGYIGTINYSTATDDRRMAFVGRPDSLVGWYLYTAGNSTEQAKVRAILHTGDYNDPETPVIVSGSTYNHPDLSANKIGDALFVSTAGVNVANWTRFSVPFNYVNTNTPAYIMVNFTSSNNQTTSVTGSKLWLDDIAVVYNSGSGINTNIAKPNNITIFYADKNLNVDFVTKTDEHSTLSIFDLTGKMIFSQKIDNNKLNTVSLSALNTGLYLYLISGTASQKAGKFIVD
jgi:hypothetical protein